jgi:hypothetical protein
VDIRCCSEGVMDCFGTRPLLWRLARRIEIVARLDLGKPGNPLFPLRTRTIRPGAENDGEIAPKVAVAMTLRVTSPSRRVRSPGAKRERDPGRQEIARIGEVDPVVDPGPPQRA